MSLKLPWLEIHRADAHGPLKLLFDSIPEPAEAPERLWLCASPQAIEAIRALPDRGIAIVGTRRPQWSSTERVGRVAASLAKRRTEAPHWVISGFARGIDEVAHEMALAFGFPTLAVLACGGDIDYPRDRERLRERVIRSGGALLTEFAPGTPPKPENFLRRNRLIAAYARATWVVEAAARSGALNTAAWATRYGRDLYASSAAPEDESHAGCLRLLEEGYARPWYGSASLGATWLGLAASS